MNLIVFTALYSNLWMSLATLLIHIVLVVAFWQNNYNDQVLPQPSQLIGFILVEITLVLLLHLAITHGSF